MICKINNIFIIDFISSQNTCFNKHVKFLLNNNHDDNLKFYINKIMYVYYYKRTTANSYSKITNFLVSKIFFKIQQ